MAPFTLGRMKSALLAAAGTIALVASAAPAAGAATVTFGADLNNPANVPNNDTTGGVCRAGVANPLGTIPGGGVTPTPLVGPGSQSCMWTYKGYAKYDRDGLGAPATGTVTAIRVKVGPVTGKMRVNVIRFNDQNGSSSGPYLEAYGPEFTPSPNSITQVPTNLRVQSDDYVVPGDPTIRSIDQLALEVEAPDVPIPLFRDPPAANNPLTGAANTYGTYPGPTEQGIEAPSYNAIPGTVAYRKPNGGVSSELGVLMSADLTTGLAPPPPPGPTGPTGPTRGGPLVKLKKTVSVPAGASKVSVGRAANPPTAATVQRLTATPKAIGARTAKKARRVVLGTGRTTIKARKTASLNVKLTKAARRRLQHGHRIKATLTVTARGTSGAKATVTRSVTLKPRKKKRR